MIATATNLDYLIPMLRVRLNDIAEPHQHSAALLRTALVSAVQQLGRRWKDRYYIFRSSMARGSNGVMTPNGLVELPALPENEYDCFRNPFATFASEPPPVIEQTDEAVILVQAALLVKTAIATSSTSVFVNWQTPDFGISNVSSAKLVLDGIEADRAELETLLRRYITMYKVSVH